MKTTKVKLKEISTINTGLPIQRYLDKEDSTEQKVIQNKPLEEIQEKFETQTEEISDDIKLRFFSKKHDILFKVQQQIFAKEITTETNAIIPNIYLIIRVDKEKVNSTFLTYYLNDPRVNYEILRQIESTRILKVNVNILKNLEIELPPKEVQNKYAQTIEKISQRIESKKESIKCDEKIIDSLYDNIIGDKYVK